MDQTQEKLEVINAAKRNLIPTDITTTFTEKSLAQLIKKSVPEGPFDLFLDIGLSFNAPHSVSKLRTNKKVFIIGIEPNPYSCSNIRQRAISAKESRFLLLNLGVGHVKGVAHQKLNITAPDPGCSSFLSVNAHKVIKSIDVNITSLEFILDNLPWEKFKSRNFEMKSDTQGYELEVLKSMGKYINNIASLQVEDDTGSQYENAPTKKEIINFLTRPERGLQWSRSVCGDSYFSRLNTEKTQVNE